MPLFSTAEFDRHFALVRSALEAHARKRVSHEDAQDLVSECYRQARLALAAYRPERDLFAWLKGILENQLRQHFRRARMRREDFIGTDTEAFEIEDAQTPISVRQHAIHRALLDLIGQIDLTARQYECLIRLLSGETQRQVGRHLGISQRMVSYHAQAAQEHLRQAADQQEARFDPIAFFYECAHHSIYRKPHSFDTQSNSVDRERQRYVGLHEAKRPVKAATSVAEKAEGKGKRQKAKVPAVRSRQ